MIEVASTLANPISLMICCIILLTNLCGQNGLVLLQLEFLRICNLISIIGSLYKLVEAAGVEPASASLTSLALHAYPSLLI